MAETSPSFTVTMNDGKSAKPEQPVPEPASKDMTWTDGKQTIKYTATAEMLPLHTDDGTLIGHMFALSYVSDAADKSKDMTWTDGKQTIKYTATAEMLPLHTDDGTLIGHMFALSYVSDAADKSDRPTWTDGKQTIKYTATAEMLPLHTDDGTLIGHMFALSYVSDAADKSDRPVTFCWNGGPGGSSAMVNIGGLGPRRVPINTIKQLPCPTKPEDNPYSLLPTTDLVYLDAMGTGYSKVAEGPRRVPINTIKQLPCPTKPEDNPYSLLPTTDLVYLDAMGTGYSKVAEGYDPKKVWGVDGDADAFMRGIAQWLTTHERWNTPLYLYGESYGTMRNSVLMRVLGERGIALTGVIEQSTILDYAPTLSGNDLYYMGMLPVYAATANYFGKAGAGVDQFEWFDRAWKFVDEKYGRALIASDSITAEEEHELAAEMSELIGLPAEFIEGKHLRIELDTFRKTIMADEGLFCGRYDTRFTEPAYMDVQGDNEFFAGEDPSGDAIMTPDQSAWMKLVQETGFKGSPINLLLSMKVNEEWNWTHQAPGTMGSPVCPNTAYDMGTALRRNPFCRVLFFGGIHDAATPFWNVKHSISKMFLPESITSRIEYKVHENGHMAYEDLPTLEKMAPELAAFYEKRHEA